MSESKPYIEFQHVHKAFGSNVVLNDVSFDVMPGETVCILGRSGVHIGGTDFDSLFSLNAVMPLLGLGSHLVAKNLPMPLAPYIALSTWATINFSYTPRNERHVAELLA